MRWRLRHVIVIGALLVALVWSRTDGNPLEIFEDRSEVGVVQDISGASLVVPPRPAEGTGSWSFLDKNDDGTPVGYDPCRTIHYVVHIGFGPLNAAEMAHEAVRTLSNATGLTFEFDGITDTVPQSDTLFDHDDPIWIGWASESETDLYQTVGHDVVGVGGSTFRQLRSGGPKQYVSGYAIVKPSSGLMPGFGPGRSEGNVLLHELGHLVGLDHVTNPEEIMHAGVGPQSPNSYGAGDLAGLWQLGAARGCS
jgi:hypothetical protein